MDNNPIVVEFHIAIIIGMQLSAKIVSVRFVYVCLSDDLVNLPNLLICHSQLVRIHYNAYILHIHARIILCITIIAQYDAYTVEPLYCKPLICGNLYNKDTILCPSVVLQCIK